MICIEVLNELIKDYRSEHNIKEKGVISMMKSKDRTLAIGPLKTFSLSLFYMKSPTDIKKLLVINHQSRSMNDESDLRAWRVIEKALNMWIYKQLLNTHCLASLSDNTYNEKIIEINVE